MRVCLRAVLVARAISGVLRVEYIYDVIINSAYLRYTK